MLLTIVLLGAIFVVFAVVLRYAFDFSWIALAFVALAFAGLQFCFADKLALAAMHSRVVNAQQALELHELVERLAAP